VPRDRRDLLGHRKLKRDLGDRLNLAVVLDVLIHTGAQGMCVFRRPLSDAEVLEARSVDVRRTVGAEEVGTKGGPRPADVGRVPNHVEPAQSIAPESVPGVTEKHIIGPTHSYLGVFEAANPVLWEQGVFGGVAIPKRDLDEFPVEVPAGTPNRGRSGRRGRGNVHRSIISHVARDGDRERRERRRVRRRSGKRSTAATKC
jgi:hypothetical protein